MSGCTSDSSPERGVVVAAVRAGTDAGAAGLRVGDRVLAVNGRALRDAIDFQFHAGDDTLRSTSSARACAAR
jgi:S1-C subfamily serine protease